MEVGSLTSGALVDSFAVSIGSLSSLPVISRATGHGEHGARFLSAFLGLRKLKVSLVKILQTRPYTFSIKKNIMQFWIGQNKNRPILSYKFKIGSFGTMKV